MSAATAERSDGGSLVSAPGAVRRRIAFDRIIGWVLLLAFVAVLFPLFDMIYWVGAKALPSFGWQTLTETQVGLGGGLYAMIYGTLLLMVIATSFATAIGIAAGFYTAEFAPPVVQRIGRLAGNLLAGVPAIVLGYFGYIALVLYTHWGPTALAAGITLGVFMVPYVYRTTDLALSNVPTSQREATLAMGASRLQYLTRVGFPIAFPTILTGIFFAMALGVGDAAPVFYTAGFPSAVNQGLLAPTSYLTGAIYLFYSVPPSEGSLLTLGFQAAFVVILIVLGLNVVVQIISDRYRHRFRGLYA